MIQTRELQDITDKYGRIFGYFFLYKALALVFILFNAIVAFGQSGKLIAALALWIVCIIYVAVAYANRKRILALVIKKPIYLGLDVLMAMVVICVFIAWNNPFYQFTLAPVVPVVFLSRLNNAVKNNDFLKAIPKPGETKTIVEILKNTKEGTIAGIFLGIASIVSVFIHGGTASELISTKHFSILFGQIWAYFILAYMCVFPADLVIEVIEQRNVIEKHAEKEAVYEERARLSREFHDNLAQSLMVLKRKIDISSKGTYLDTRNVFEEMRELVSITLQDLRNAIFSLKPDNMENDIDMMLNKWCRQLSSVTECKILTEISTGTLKLATDRKLEILYFCQEALGNAIRHAGADHVLLKAFRNEQNLLVCIEDCGCGFDVSVPGNGEGLLNMHKRAANLNGILDITSMPGEGTKLELTIPLERQVMN